MKNGSYQGFLKHSQLRNKLGICYAKDVESLNNFLKKYENSFNYHSFAQRYLKETYPCEFVKGCIKTLKGDEIKQNPYIMGLSQMDAELIRDKIVNTNTKWADYFLHVFDTLIETGWRLGELCSIDWNNIEIAANGNDRCLVPYIVEKRKIDKVKPLSNELYEYWKAHQYDYQCQYKRIQRMFIDFKKIWGMSNKFKLSAHILRHTTTVISIDAGISVEQVSYFTDHVDTRNTMKVYYKSASALNNVANVVNIGAKYRRNKNLTNNISKVVS